MSNQTVSNRPSGTSTPADGDKTQTGQAANNVGPNQNPIIHNMFFQNPGVGAQQQQSQDNQVKDQNEYENKYFKIHSKKKNNIEDILIY